MIDFDLQPIIITLLVLAAIIGLILGRKYLAPQSFVDIDQLVRKSDNSGGVLTIAAMIALGGTFFALAAGQSTASKQFGGRGGGHGCINGRHAFVIVDWSNETTK